MDQATKKELKYSGVTKEYKIKEWGKLNNRVLIWLVQGAKNDGKRTLVITYVSMYICIDVSIHIHKI